VVSLVEDEGLDTIQTHCTLPHQIEQAPGAGNEYRGLSGQSRALAVDRYAAEDGRHPKGCKAAQALDFSADLSGELTGRRQHQGSRPGPGGSYEAIEYRQCKRRGLARTGLSQAEHIAALAGCGNGLGLNRSGLDIARRDNPAAEPRVEVEGFESVFGSFCLFLHTYTSLRLVAPSRRRTTTVVLPTTTAIGRGCF
jgi:hypothetical protein